ncbi:MAG: hypothetical protein KC619_05160 [Myxococcales bacterium]|nr:hypothetical protein [Myxococcales bacterium]
MSEPESAHGKLSKVDREWTSTRFMVLFTATVIAALVIIYSISSLKLNEWTWSGWIAHDPVQHSLQSSQL